MSTILGSLSTVFTSVIAMVGDVAETITASGNEILLLFALIPLVGIGVGLFKRLLNVN